MSLPARQGTVCHIKNTDSGQTMHGLVDAGEVLAVETRVAYVAPRLLRINVSGTSAGENPGGDGTLLGS
jgi:hypothetical protein